MTFICIQAMHKRVLVLTCMVCWSLGRRHSVRSRSRSSASTSLHEGARSNKQTVVEDGSDSWRTLSAVLLGLDPASAFRPAETRFPRSPLADGRRSLAPTVARRFRMPRAEVEVVYGTPPRELKEVAVAPAKVVVRKTDPWFSSAVALSPAARSPVIDELRSAASVALASVRRPSRLDEAWRRMDFQFLKQQPEANADEDVSDILARYADEENDGMRLVLRGGKIDTELSDLSALPAGVQVGALNSIDEAVAARAVEALRELPEAPETSDGDTRFDLGIFGFAALNQASMTDVACVHVPAGVKLERPLHVFMLSKSSGGGLAVSSPNLWVDLADGAEMKLEEYHAGSGFYFQNALTRVSLGTDAKLVHVYVQEQPAEAVHLDSMMVDLGAKAFYKNQVIQKGSAVSRINLAVGLCGPLASIDMAGLALASDNQMLDAHTRITHVSAGCTTQHEHRQVAIDRGRIVFKGEVYVPKGSDETRSNQQCRTLLLSDKARADMTPQLRIMTDDVECFHGATTIDLSEEMIFYLQSRGFSRERARPMILEGWAREFASEVTTKAAKDSIVAKAAEFANQELNMQQREKGFAGFSSI